MATGSCHFAGDTPGKVERAPAAATCNPCGSRTRATGASIVWWIRAVAGQFMAWEGGRERQRAIALTLHGMLSRKVFGVGSHLASTKDCPVAFPGPGSQAIRRRPGVDHPTWVPTGQPGVRNARRSQPTPESRHDLTIVQVRSTARGGLQSGHPSLPSDWRRLPRQTPSQIVTRLGRLAFHDNRQNGHHDARLWPRNRHPPTAPNCLSLCCRDRHMFDEARRKNHAHLTMVVRMLHVDLFIFMD